MILKDLKLPQNLNCDELIKGPQVTPMQRLEIMDPSRFEELTEVWLLGKEDIKYRSVKRNAGSGDRGRDVVCYHVSSSDIDIYQCKHYKDQLNWSDLKEEFYKLCYFTFIKDYPVPKSYFIVSAKGCSNKLRTDYIDKPAEINKALINHLLSNDVKMDKTSLRSLPGFIKYLEEFDFKFVHEITPGQLIDEFWGSKFRPYYLGGALKKFQKEKVIVPPSISAEETEYINQLLTVYSEQTGEKYNAPEKISDAYRYHFEMQRTYFYSIESFKRCVRDNLPSMQPFDEIEETISQGINDIVSNPKIDGFEKLSNSLSRSVEMNMDNCTLKSELYPNEKKGICHLLANKKTVRWV